jgi:hypothetical protein
MLRALLVASVIAAVGAASGATASAGIYLGLGIGTAPSTSVSSNNNQASVPISTDGNGRSARLILGERLGRFSIEGDVDHYGLLLNDAPFDAWDAALLLKYSQPIGNGFELFGKGGLVHTWVTSGGDAPTGANLLNSTGDGWVLGAGIEYRINLLLAGCSIFVDYELGSSKFGVDNTQQTYDQTTGMAMLGATVSL